MLLAYKENIKSFYLKLFTKLSELCIYTVKTFADSVDIEILCQKS